MNKLISVLTTSPPCGRRSVHVHTFAVRRAASEEAAEAFNLVDYNFSRRKLIT